MTSDTPAQLQHWPAGPVPSWVATGDRAASAGLPEPLVLPAYGGACLDSLAPALLLSPGRRPAWLPGQLRDAGQVVLLVLDGLGWLQLEARAHLAPVLTSMEGGPISSVAPTTTATALTSLSSGMPPAAHGIIGYKFLITGPSGKEVLNVLRWTTRSGDARQFLPPRSVQSRPAFNGVTVPVVSRADFANSGFTQAHQQGVREVPWFLPSSIPHLVRTQLSLGEPLVYAYYDGIDKVAHAVGFGELYDAELRFVDRLVGDLLSAMPADSVLAVVADHGQVDVGQRAALLGAEVLAECELSSGEARFRWLHALPGRAEALFDRASERYGGTAWVATRDEVVSTGVFGGVPSDDAMHRLGDVALVPLGDDGYLDPQDSGDAKLVCRHGGLTPEEMLVPLVAAVAP
ncbi:MAG TPA: alkaline phosphatase family protein [Acidimicrobiales bacterium]|nr:alkaline phosphatase family protein [Acidimicrobiales bacterium]